MRYTFSQSTRRLLSRLVGVCALVAAPTTGCEPEKGGGKAGTVDSGTEEELPPFPEAVLGVPSKNSILDDRGLS